MSILYDKFAKLFDRKKMLRIKEQLKSTELGAVFKELVRLLLRWNKTDNKRQMPWKGEKNPYRIWLSEIILQQTRVDQGLKYYERFIKAYPSIADLSQAPEKEVYKLWEGLGYYSRCKNLIATANYISTELGGVFPKSHKEILSLKGVGSYTAAAISSFAYNQPHAVLDGNVFRVLARIFDIEIPIDSTKGKVFFSSLAQTLLPVKRAGEYNQAIMDFGATICKPLPECSICFFNTRCQAFLQNKQQLLPVKLKQISIKERWFNYLILRHKSKIAIRQRTGKDIWQNLFEFLLIESNKKTALKKQLLLFQKNYDLKEVRYSIEKDPIDLKQRLSHQIIHFQIIRAEISKTSLPKDIIWVDVTELKNYPFPRTLQQYIQDQI